MKWQAWGRLIGPALPGAPIRVGQYEIGTRSGRVPAIIDAPPVQISSGRPYLRIRASLLEAGSDCWVVINDIEAPDADDAHRQAGSEYLPRIVAALSAQFGALPFRIQLVGVQSPNDGYSYSSVQAVTEFEPDVLKPSDAREALVTWQDAFEKSDYLRAAAHALARGIDLYDQIGGTATSASAILAFYQAIESSSYVAPWSRPSDFDEQRTEIIRVLKNTLDSRKSVEKKAAAIETANRGLSRLDAKYASLRIEHAARSFGLSTKWIDRARELSKLRNSRLGHGATAVRAEDLASWEHGTYSPDSAYGLAASMLAGAVRFYLR